MNIPDNIRALLQETPDSLRVKARAIQEFFLDATNDYETRKFVYLNTPSHLKSHYPYMLYLSEFESVYGEICWYDDFNIEKYQVVDFTRINFSINFFQHKTRKLNDKMVDDFLDSAMKTGYHSFIFEW